MGKEWTIQPITPLSKIEWVSQSNSLALDSKLSFSTLYCFDRDMWKCHFCGSSIGSIYIDLIGPVSEWYHSDPFCKHHHPWCAWHWQMGAPQDMKCLLSLSLFNSCWGGHRGETLWVQLQVTKECQEWERLCLPGKSTRLFTQDQMPALKTHVWATLYKPSSLYEVCADASTYIHITTINENRSHELEKEQSVVYKKGLGGRKDREDDVIIL